MLPSHFSASYLGAATPSSNYHTVYQQLQYLSRVYPGLTRVCPLSLPASHTYSSFDPRAFAAMGTPETNTGLQPSRCARSSPSDLSHILDDGVTGNGWGEKWNNSDNEESQGKMEEDGDDQKISDTTSTSSLRPRAQPSWSEPRANTSAVKFSIDSILGLKTNSSSDQSVRISRSNDTKKADVSAGSAQNSSSYQQHCQQNVVKDCSTNHREMAQRSESVAENEGSGERGEEEGRKGEENAIGEEQNNFPWLQCTRYHPPKLQRTKKKDGGGKKRKLGRNPRVPFTQHQVAVLEEKFRRTHYLSSMDVAELSTALTLSETRVKIWFQNRRARERREREAAQRAQLLTQKPYQPLSIPSVTWALTASQLTPSPFSAAQYRNDMNFRAGLFSSALSAFSTPVRHEVTAETKPSTACPWPDSHNSDDDSFY